MHYLQRHPKAQPFTVSCVICTRFHILHCYSPVAPLICISVPFISLFVTHSCKTAIFTYWFPYLNPRQENQEVGKIERKKWNTRKKYDRSAHGMCTCVYRTYWHLLVWLRKCELLVRWFQLWDVSDAWFFHIH